MLHIDEVLTDAHTSRNVLRSGIPVCAHDSCCHMRLSIIWAMLSQSKIRELRVEVLNIIWLQGDKRIIQDQRHCY